MSDRRKNALRSVEANTSKHLMKDYTLEDLHLYRVNRHSFTIFVGGDPSSFADDGGGEPGVDYHMANRFDMNLDLLTTINPQRPILINMASCGGYWEEGLQMFGAILWCPNPVTVLATKDARSMTSIIPLAADRFVIRPPTKYMIHRGTYEVSGIEQEIDTCDTERRKDNEMMLRLYIARLREQGAHKRWSEARIREMLVRRMEKVVDVWMTGDEAVAAGYADALFDGDLKKLRATRKDTARRARMLDVLRKPIEINITTS